MLFYIKFIMIYLSVYLFFRMVLLPTLSYLRNKQRKSILVDEMKKAIEESREETELLQSGLMPTDEHILLYYKMYLKKFEKDQWSEWDTAEPMSFEEWEERAKMCLDTVGGYRFIIGQTMDMFIGGMGGSSMLRHTDYRRLVEYDEMDRSNTKNG